MESFNRNDSGRNVICMSVCEPVRRWRRAHFSQSKLRGSLTVVFQKQTLSAISPRLKSETRYNTFIVNEKLIDVYFSVLDTTLLHCLCQDEKSMKERIISSL
jgi:hypothetical protein